MNDASGFALAYVYYEEEPGRRTAAKLMTQDEARRIATNIARLLELLNFLIRRLRGITSETGDIEEGLVVEGRETEPFAAAIRTWRE